MHSCIYIYLTFLFVYIKDFFVMQYSSLSEVDVGPLTSQQSRVSLASVTPTPASNIDKTIFDDTLNLAYKTSTFTRSNVYRFSFTVHLSRSNEICK